MTLPLRITPGSLLYVTRRCWERRLFLKPSERFNHVFEYLLAVGLQKFNMKAVVTTAMSNHYHALMVDVEGRAPKFYEWFHKELSKATNQMNKRSGGLWENEKTSGIEVLDPVKALEIAAYTLCNPTKAGLVSEGRLWPGHRSSPRAAVSGSRVIKRPDEKYFRKSKTVDDGPARTHPIAVQGTIGVMGVVTGIAG